MKLRSILLATVLCALCVSQAGALEYSVEAPEDYLFGRPTSDETIYEQEPVNVDRSKDTALVAPAFGSPTASSQAAYPSLHPLDEAHSFRCSSFPNCDHYVGSQLGSLLPGSGEALTPNLIPGAPDGGGLVSSTGSVSYPTVEGGSSPAVTQATRYTAVTPDLYYSGGHLGTLKIPALGLSVKVYEGTASTQLAKGAGHFTGTSIWDGNICVAAHNRGVNDHFGKIHTLDEGDTITLTTKLGTRTYAVTSVEKVLETDTSGTVATTDDRITLYTCVKDQSAYRWCARAVDR